MDSRDGHNQINGANNIDILKEEERHFLAGKLHTVLEKTAEAYKEYAQDMADLKDSREGGDYGNQMEMKYCVNSVCEDGGTCPREGGVASGTDCVETYNEEMGNKNGKYFNDWWKIHEELQGKLDPLNDQYHKDRFQARETHLNGAATYLKSTMYPAIDVIDNERLTEYRNMAAFLGGIDKSTNTVFNVDRSQIELLISKAVSVSKGLGAETYESQRLLFADLSLLQYNIPEFILRAERTLRERANYYQMAAGVFANAMEHVKIARDAHIDWAKADFAAEKAHYEAVSTAFRTFSDAVKAIFKTLMDAWENTTDCIDTDQTDTVNPCTEGTDNPGQQYQDARQKAQEDYAAALAVYDAAVEAADEARDAAIEANRATHEENTEKELCTDYDEDCENARREAGEDAPEGTTVASASPLGVAQRNFTQAKNVYKNGRTGLAENFGSQAGNEVSTWIQYLMSAYYDAMTVSRIEGEKRKLRIGIEFWRPKSKDEAAYEAALKAARDAAEKAKNPKGSGKSGGKEGAGKDRKSGKDKTDEDDSQPEYPELDEDQINELLRLLQEFKGDDPSLNLSSFFGNPKQAGELLNRLKAEIEKRGIANAGQLNGAIDRLAAQLGADTAAKPGSPLFSSRTDAFVLSLLLGAILTADPKADIRQHIERAVIGAFSSLLLSQAQNPSLGAATRQQIHELLISFVQNGALNDDLRVQIAGGILDTGQASQAQKNLIFKRT